MAITVSGVAASRKTPGVYVKTYPGTSAAGGGKIKECVLVGQQLSAGSMSAGDIEACSGEDAAKTLAGQGSELHLMARGFFAVNPGGNLYLGSATAGTTASTRTVTFANAATAAGYYYIWCLGNQYTLTISNGDSIANMADNLAAGIQASEWYGDMPFTCASDGVSVVTFTTRNLGPQSQWAVSCIYQSDTDLPGTTTATLSAVSASGGNAPTLTTIIAAMTSSDYDYVGCSSLDATAITAIEAHIDAMVAPTVGYRQQWILGSQDTYSNAKTMAQTNANYRRIQVVWGQSDREVYWETIGRMVGLRSLREEADPAFPYSKFDGSGESDLPGYLGHHLKSSYPTPTNIENCLNNSITPICMVGSTGRVARSITSYSLNGSTPDYTCLDTAAVTVVDYMADTLESVLSSKFGGKKLADDYTDPTDTPPGVATPSMLKDVIYYELKKAEQKGYCSNVDSYKDSILVEKDAAVDGRANFECPVEVMDGAYIIAGNVRGF